MPNSSACGPSQAPRASGPVVADLTEAELIRHISDQLPSPPDWLVVGIGDDAAIVEPERNRLEVLSVDALVEGVHFDRTFTPPAAIGHRALAVNLSDLAAMGATPRLALLSLALPHALPFADFSALVASFAALATRYRTTVVGGNLTRTPGPLVIDVTVTGTVKRRQVLTRRGAKAGDELYVTGSIGAAAAGLHMLKAGAIGAEPGLCIQTYLYPEPRIRMGTLLGRNRAAAACMDLSDGLAEGVRQMAEASGVGVVVEAEALPLDRDAHRWFERNGGNPIHEAIAGGDDYELLVATRPRTRGRLAAARRHGDVPLTRIGVCTADRALVLRRGTTDEPLPGGYKHFR